MPRSAYQIDTVIPFALNLKNLLKVPQKILQLNKLVNY